MFFAPTLFLVGRNQQELLGGQLHINMGHHAPVICLLNLVICWLKPTAGGDVDILKLRVITVFWKIIVYERIQDM